MKHALKFIALLAALTLLMLLVRAFAFTIYEVPADVDAYLRRGDCVLVNRFCRSGFRRGDLIAFNDSVTEGVARVVALPGDTVTVKGQRFIIPIHCCDHCPCPDCRLYMVRIGRVERLVHLHWTLGKAVRLYHLPW